MRCSLHGRYIISDKATGIGDTATGSERGDTDESDRSPTRSRQVRERVCFDQIDCRPTVYHPGGIFEELAPLPPGLLRDPWAQSWGNVFGSSASHHTVRDLLPCVLGPRKSRLPLFTRKQQKLLDKAREMDGFPDLSALLKGKLQLLTKKSTSVDPQGPSNSGVDVTSEGGGTSREGASREGASREEGPIATDQAGTAETSASGPKKKKKTKRTKVGATDEVPPEESAPLDATSEGSKSKKKKDGRKRSRGGAEGQEAVLVGVASDGHPRKRTKRSVEAEPRPSTSDANAADVAIVDTFGEASGTPGKLSEERRKTCSREGGSSGEPARSTPDSSARKRSGSEGSVAKRKRVEFPDRVEFSYNEMTPLILNPLRCAELTRQIRGGTKEMPQLEDLYFRNEYIDDASSRARLKSACAAKKELARENTLPAEHVGVPEGGGPGGQPENENLEEVPGKDKPEMGNTPVREEETGNVGIEEPVLVLDSSSEGREGEEDDRIEPRRRRRCSPSRKRRPMKSGIEMFLRLLLWTLLSLLRWKTRLLLLPKTQSVLLLLGRQRGSVKILQLEALSMSSLFLLCLWY
ncbi:hypothetical protein HID58_088396 [Brassica napus]|uniref:Uncharacterized protein n=1 Tax=Brassica napus TaxID=3708 RepID=A0ABQ7XW17_BRANA|nr:hypothetical protein HID58_088396 [Brassica napus]